ncbi:MAG: hypothetical protein KIT14_11640 [bacterium]|nr:hypothetical protein [bacterium]
MSGVQSAGSDGVTRAPRTWRRLVCQVTRAVPFGRCTTSSSAGASGWACAAAGRTARRTATTARTRRPRAVLERFA